MSSTTSKISQQLTRALALQLVANESSHLAPLTIAGADNDMADLASRPFKRTGALTCNGKLHSGVIEIT